MAASIFTADINPAYILSQRYRFSSALAMHPSTS
ncbi:hypothetical protein BN439_2756 [Erwinia amylovora Ea644]|nr:hypothetical protein BN439_2756 [Erwinia amylovora Ea644]CCP07863.1 hypothetical protein BN440_2850 [Erwinia amylovora MR1]